MGPLIGRAIPTAKIRDQAAALDGIPNAIGQMTVDIAANVAEDADGNGNAAAVRLQLGIPYDDNGNRVIDRGEAIGVIRDYFSGTLARAQVIVVIQLYFASGS